MRPPVRSQNVRQAIAIEIRRRDHERIPSPGEHPTPGVRKNRSARIQKDHVITGPRIREDEVRAPVSVKIRNRYGVDNPTDDLIVFERELPPAVIEKERDRSTRSVTGDQIEIAIAVEIRECGGVRQTIHEQSPGRTQLSTAIRQKRIPIAIPKKRSHIRRCHCRTEIHVPVSVQVGNHEAAHSGSRHYRDGRREMTEAIVYQNDQLVAQSDVCQ